MGARGCGCVEGVGPRVFARQHNVHFRTLVAAVLDTGGLDSVSPRELSVLPTNPHLYYVVFSDEAVQIFARFLIGCLFSHFCISGDLCIKGTLFS